MINSKRTMGIIFSNMHDHLLPDLTASRTMGSVPFGGRYRMIDFPLSNMVNAEIFEIGLITKSNYHSLMQHIGSATEWDLDRKKGGLQILPPYGDSSLGLYRGKMEALGATLSFIKASTAKYVALSDSDVVCNLNLKPAINFHINSGADITLVCNQGFYSTDAASVSTTIDLDEENRVTGVSVGGKQSGNHNLFLNIMVMKKDFLEKLVEDCLSKGMYSFERDVLQKTYNQYYINAYLYDTYVRKLCSMKYYFESNMELLRKKTRDQIFIPDRPVYTKIHDEVPAKYGLDANVKNSLIADGSIIEGEVENSIISRGVLVKKGAKIKNSILMRGVVIGQKSEVNYAVADHDVNVLDYRTVSGSREFPVYITKNASV